MGDIVALALSVSRFTSPVLEVSTRSVGIWARQVTIERMQAAAATSFPTNPLPLWHLPAEGAQPWRGADEDSPWNRRDLEGDFGSGSELSSGEFTVPPALPPLGPPRRPPRAAIRSKLFGKRF